MVADNKAGVIAPGAQSLHHSTHGVTALSPELPPEPLIKIRPYRSWATIDLREIWVYRELFMLLIWRDLKVRYKQTLLGASWVILQPLMMTLVFTIFLGLIGHPPMKNVPYPLFLYAGLVPWIFFSSAVLGSSQSLISNAKLIRKIYFPRVILPMATVGVRLSDFFITFAVILVLMFYYGIYPAWSLLMLPLILLNMAMLAVGIGTLFAALNIKYRDVATVLPVLLQLWMFSSPIIYPSSLVPQRWRLLYHLNPLAGIVEGFRASLFNLEFNWMGLASSFGVTFVLLVYVSYTFRRMEDELADTI